MLYNLILKFITVKVETNREPKLYRLLFQYGYLALFTR